MLTPGGSYLRMPTLGRWGFSAFPSRNSDFGGHSSWKFRLGSRNSRVPSTNGTHHSTQYMLPWQPSLSCCFFCNRKARVLLISDSQSLQPSFLEQASGSVCRASVKQTTAQMLMLRNILNTGKCPAGGEGLCRHRHTAHLQWVTSADWEELFFCTLFFGWHNYDRIFPCFQAPLSKCAHAT